MKVNSNLTIYHQDGLDVATHLEKWVRYNYDNVWFFGGENASINKGIVEANNVEIIFEKIGLNITLSASMKSLKEQAKTFIEKVASDLKLIEMEEYSNEILFEYNNCMDYVEAKTKVLERHKQLEEIQKQQENRSETEQKEEEIVEKVDEAIEITAPTEIVEELESTPSVYQFEVKATKEQIKKLIDFMKELGVEYK